LKRYLRLTGILILCVILSKVDLAKLISSLSSVNIFLIFFIVLLNIPQIFIKACRWAQMLGTQSIQYNLKDSFIVYLAGIYAGILTPGRLVEFIKAVYLKTDKSISLSKGMSSVIIDRLFDLYLLIILGLLGIWQFGILGKLSNTSLILMIILISAPLLILNKQLTGKIISLIYHSVIKKKAQVKDKIEETFEDFYNGVTQLLTFRLLFSVLLTCLSYSVFFIQCYLIAIAMGISIN